MIFQEKKNIIPKNFPEPQIDVAPSSAKQTAILGGGCFWCVEQIYDEIHGIESVISGYSGGSSDSANYEAVCSGNTDHIEVVKIKFDSNKITFGTILKLFFSVVHDPTQIERQGADIGLQYSSVIFCQNKEQFNVSKQYIELLNQAKIFSNQIATKIIDLKEFYEAENYHQKYAKRNPNQPYILGVSYPKLQKLINSFPELIKNL
ncbi:MAG: Peptide methionine sulfoxide reductase MsrA [Alphaproteobacteria bacterium MarineAlpha2_Bin1]|nr:MAG: Peptide methionine sulfoxide reductase MsrA [Alphaproteobacteria bacterium MarineAlpha2_Bin1]